MKAIAAFFKGVRSVLSTAIGMFLAFCVVVTLFLITAVYHGNVKCYGDQVVESCIIDMTFKKE